MIGSVHDGYLLRNCEVKTKFPFVTLLFQVLSLGDDPPILEGGFKKVDKDQWIILHYSPFKVCFLMSCFY